MLSTVIAVKGHIPAIGEVKFFYIFLNIAMAEGNKAQVEETLQSYLSSWWTVPVPEASLFCTLFGLKMPGLS